MWWWPLPGIAQNLTNAKPVRALKISQVNGPNFSEQYPKQLPLMSPASQPIESPSTNAQDLLSTSESDSTQNGVIDFDTTLPLATIADNAQDDKNTSGAQDTSNSQKPFSFYFGSRLPDPTALKGPTRKPTTGAEKDFNSGGSLSAGAQANFSKALKLFTEVRGGLTVFGVDLSLFYGSDDLRRGVSVNFFDQQSHSPSFVGGTEVNLPNGRTPWVDRLGGGVEFHQPLSHYLDSVLGLTYQSVTVRDSFLGSNQQPVDQLGNRLTVGPSGQDDLLTVNLAVGYDNRDDPKRPTRGTHLKFGLDQSIPIGTAAINMTRLDASVSQFIPLPFFLKKKSTLVFNVQGGHIFGDVPPYEAFNLGGDDTVRGFGTGDIGTGSSFIEATVEYRFPLFSLRVLSQPIAIGGRLFVDYGSLLGTQNDVIGQPGLVRNKPGDGLGYGAGVSFDTRYGLVRVDGGLNNRGGGQADFSFGERF